MGHLPVVVQSKIEIKLKNNHRKVLETSPSEGNKSSSPTPSTNRRLDQTLMITEFDWKELEEDLPSEGMDS